MLYKAFAVVTLVAAPVIVLMVQGLAPHAPAQSVSVPMQPVVERSAPMPQYVPPPAMEQPAAAPMSFGQPMPEAGRPFLSPGNGLPGASSAAEDVAVENDADAGSDAP